MHSMYYLKIVRSGYYICYYFGKSFFHSCVTSSYIIGKIKCHFEDKMLDRLLVCKITVLFFVSNTCFFLPEIYGRGWAHIWKQTDSSADQMLWFLAPLQPRVDSLTEMTAYRNLCYLSIDSQYGAFYFHWQLKNHFELNFHPHQI